SRLTIPNSAARPPVARFTSRDRMLQNASYAGPVHAVGKLVRCSYFFSSQPLTEQVRLAVGRTFFNLELINASKAARCFPFRLSIYFASSLNHIPLYLPISSFASLGDQPSSKTRYAATMTPVRFCPDLQ